MIGLVVVTLLAVGERDWACERATEVWAPLELPAPCTVLKGAKPETYAKLLGAAWKLDDAQAACAAQALVADEATPHRFSRTPPPNPWVECVNRFPTVLAFWPTVFGYRAPHRLLAAPIAKLAASDGGQLALEKLLTLERPPIEVVLAAFHAAPTSLINLLTTQRLASEVRGELAATAMDERGAQLSREEWAALTAPLMETLLERQAVLLAAEYFLRLPEYERQRFAAASNELSSAYQDSPRVGLAIGLAALGKKEQARSIQLPAPSERAKDGVWREALEFLLTGKRTSSPWDAAVNAAEARVGGPELVAATLPFFAGAEELPIADMQRSLEWLTERDDDFGERFARQFAAARERALKKLRAQWLQKPGAESSATALPDAMPSPWKERTAKWWGKSNPGATATLPRGFWAVRVEKQGTRLVALATSQALDPVGEVGPGGYWLLVSSDRGSTWKKAYLSLGVHHPFHAYQSSKVPLLDDKDVVRLDLEDAPLDERSITFPPIALSTVTKRAQVILEAPLAVLNEDSDGDGFSNLVEARLLLDPRNPDTDGDGFIDGDDFTPRIDDHLAPTVKAEMLNAFFEDFGSGRKAPQAIVMSPDHDGGLDLGRPRASTLDDVHFLLGTPEELAGVKPMGTFITLTDAELELARARYGTFYPMDLTITVFGNDHAYIRWSEQWRGGSVRVDRDKNGKLVVKSLSSWIT